MKLYFLSVGYGEAIVLRDGDQCLVIDGGPGAEDPAYQHAGTIRLADFLSQQGIRKINYMICTHLHNDHLGGLADVAEQFCVQEFWINCWPTESPAQAIATALSSGKEDLSLYLFATGLRHLERLRKAFAAQGTIVRERAETSSYETLWPGCRIRLFGMDRDQIDRRRTQFHAFCRENDADKLRNSMRDFDKEENKCSLACSLGMNHIVAMLTGDLCSGWDERCAAPDFPKGDILKLTHHGQRDGMPMSLTVACDPQVFLMCADAERTFHSACDEVYDRAKEYLAMQNRKNHVYTTGLLSETFGRRNGRPPCALCCSVAEQLHCIPYYSKKGGMEFGSLSQ